jgi:ribonuclease P protein component
VQRLKTRAQYEAAMAGGTVSRTAHFVLHRAPSSPQNVIPAQVALRHPREGGDPGLPDPDALDSRLRGKDGGGVLRVEEVSIGAVVPKRWAKRAVTRNGIKRQIYNVSATFETRLPAAAHVVRLRADFARKQFPSAWSDALKAAVRGELLQLFERAAA